MPERTRYKYNKTVGTNGQRKPELYYIYYVYIVVKGGLRGIVVMTTGRRQGGIWEGLGRRWGGSGDGLAGGEFVVGAVVVEDHHAGGTAGERHLRGIGGATF